MLSHLRPALTLLVLFTVLTGLAYPYALTGVAQALFPAAANGSLIEAGGKVVGSRLIGQTFTRADYFRPRPSAAGTGYDGAASSGTNLAPTSAKLADRLKTDAAALRAANLGPSAGDLPADSITTSGSGLDPDISPAFALGQAPAVAKARGLPEDTVRKLVLDRVKGRVLGVLGEPRVNVLDLNLALDQNGKTL